MKNYGDSVYVYDMGINMAGYCQLSIKGESGTKWRYRHGELLKPDGRLETGNIDIYFRNVLISIFKQIFIFWMVKTMYLCRRLIIMVFSMLK